MPLGLNVPADDPRSTTASAWRWRRSPACLPRSIYSLNPNMERRNSSSWSSRWSSSAAWIDTGRHRSQLRAGTHRGLTRGLLSRGLGRRSIFVIIGHRASHQARRSSSGGPPDGRTRFRTTANRGRLWGQAGRPRACRSLQHGDLASPSDRRPGWRPSSSNPRFLMTFGGCALALFAWRRSTSCSRLGRGWLFLRPCGLFRREPAMLRLHAAKVWGLTPGNSRSCPGTRAALILRRRHRLAQPSAPRQGHTISRMNDAQPLQPEMEI